MAGSAATRVSKSCARARGLLAEEPGYPRLEADGCAEVPGLPHLRPARTSDDDERAALLAWWAWRVRRPGGAGDGSDAFPPACDL